MSQEELDNPAKLNLASFKRAINTVSLLASMLDDPTQKLKVVRPDIISLRYIWAL